MITFWHYSPCPPFCAKPAAQPGRGQNSLIGMADPTSMTQALRLRGSRTRRKGIRRRIEFFAARRRCCSRKLRLSQICDYASTQPRRLVAIDGSPKKGHGAEALRTTLTATLPIAVRLIPPLLSMGYHATRSDASKDKLEKRDSACSIVCGALKRIGIHISEKRIEGIWAKFSPLFSSNRPNVGHAKQERSVHLVIMSLNAAACEELNGRYRNPPAAAGKTSWLG